jgi:hypothetical protein
MTLIRSLAGPRINFSLGIVIVTSLPAVLPRSGSKAKIFSGRRSGHSLA